MANCLLGIDYGTGGTKAVLIDFEGHELAHAYEEYEIIHERDGWSEHDAKNYWDAACRMIRVCLEKSGRTGTDVAGVAVSSALPSLVMIDEHGNPVNRGYNLLDRRASEQVEHLRNEIGEDVLFELTGSRLEDHPAIVNLLWERDKRPNDFARVRKALTIDGFITYRLTGIASLHYSGAAFFGVAYDIRNRRFHEPTLSAIGISFDLMPELFNCEDIVGEVTPNAASETGLATGTPVAAGQVDCNASWIGAGATQVGDIQCNLGTVGNFGVVYDDQSFTFSEIGRKLLNFPYTVDSERNFVSVPTTLTGGQTLRYLRDQFSQAEKLASDITSVSVYDLLTLPASKIPPGSEGLIALPYLMGERTPLWDANARGTVFGLSLTHGKAHLTRAMMEGVAYALNHNYSLIQQAGLKVRLPIVLNEGGAVSRVWRQIITDVLGVPTVMIKRRSGAPFGDAILAGVATGVYTSFHVTREWAEYVDPMEPDANTHERYTEYFELYKKLYESLKDNFRELARIRTKYS
ncbi:MAG: carbohydrate kinase [Spirochaetaceae bacterium]|nr:MAG: carbohydrate kinase [Spirochaetaceae bacterium]